MDFTVTLIDPCPTETITMSNATLTDTVITYHIYNQPYVLQLNLNALDRSVTSVTCPQVTYFVEMQDPLESFDPEAMVYDNATGFLTT